ncbi:MAG: TetR family transcriptional regulator [Gemmatimonadota bacterium]|jgi:AcrR family transcriptional regulator
MTQTDTHSAGGRGEDTRAALLDAGKKLFAQKGFDGTSVRDITRVAGANLGAITYHFGSKRALYSAVLEAGFASMVDRVGEVASSGGPAMERLERVIEVILEHVAANPEIPRLMLQEVAAGKTPPAEVVAMVRRHAGYIISILSDGWADGTIRQAHPVFSALSVVSQPIFMNVVAPMIREVAGIDLAKRDARVAVADHIKAFVHSGLQGPQETPA